MPASLLLQLGEIPSKTRRPAVNKFCATGSYLPAMNLRPLPDIDTAGQILELTVREFAQAAAVDCVDKVVNRREAQCDHTCGRVFELKLHRVALKRFGKREVRAERLHIGIAAEPV